MAHAQRLPVHLDIEGSASALVDALAVIPVPHPGQQVALIRRAQAGDRAARDAVVIGNIRLVAKIAGQFRDSGLSYDDLIQEGVIGLLRAVDGFDCDRNLRLSTYAVWWIRQAIQRAIDNRARTIRVPTRVSGEIRAVARAEQAIRASGGDPVQDEESIARLAGITIERLAELRTVSQSCLSLDSPAGDGERSSSLGELQVDHGAREVAEEALENIESRMLWKCLRAIDPREAAAVALRGGLDGAMPHRPEHIARRLGVSTEEASNLIAQGMMHLREELERLGYAGGVGARPA